MGKGIKLPKKPVSRKKFREMARAATEQIQQQRAAAQLAADTIQQGRAAFTEADGTREERIARTRDSALEFGKVYLSHYFEQKGAEFHSALDKLLTGNYTPEDLKRWIDEFGIEIHEGDPVLKLLAIMIPRGHGKSVIAILCDGLRRICHGLDPYIIIGSDTLDQAASQLEDLKDELEFNDKIKADFGSLKPRKGVWEEAHLVRRDDGRVVWREGRIITTNQIRVDAIGRGGKMRGRRFGTKRPTHILLDDLDNDENVATKEQRDKAWNWVISAVEPARDPMVGRIVLIGTNINFDCTIARAVRKTAPSGQRFFTSIKFSATKRDAAGNRVATWPQRFSIESLNAKRDLMGPAKYGAEYENDPRDPLTALFNVDIIKWYPPSAIEGKSLRRVLYVDPSKGKKKHGRKKSDYSGFADAMGDPAERVTYLLDAFRERLSPHAAKQKILAWYPPILRENSRAELHVEENSFGEVLGAEFQDELRKSGVDKVVHTLLHSAPKDERMQRLSIRIANGGLLFPQRWEDPERRPDWFSEMEDYPGPFDDTIDAIESADSVLSKSVEAASGGIDPPGKDARERAQAGREERFMSRILGIRKMAA